MSAALATRWGGACAVACHEVTPMYELPVTPTFPSDQGCAAAHSTASYPSAPSCWNGSKVPSDRYRPRTSWFRAAYPLRARAIEPALSQALPVASEPRLYGLRVKTTG